MVTGISSTEIFSVNQMLKRLDADNDGSVNENELVSQRSENVSAARAAEVFNQIDWNRDGQLSEGELSATYQLISSQTLNTLLENQSVDEATLQTYGNDLTTDPENAFAELDQDGDGVLTETEFVFAREAGSASKATALWEQILSNSKAPDGSTEINASEFAVGVGITQEQAAEVSGFSSRSKTINAINDLALGDVNLGTDNASDLFSSIDSDQNGFIDKADFLAGVPKSVTASQANSLWSRIVANSGNSSSAPALSEDQFSTGFYAIQSNSIDQASGSLDEDAIQEMMTLIKNLGGSSASGSAYSTSETSDVSLDDPYAVFTEIDSDQDGSISESDFLNSMSSLSASQASSLWANIVAHSGADEGSDLTQDQFVTGYLDREIALPSEDDSSSSTVALNSLLVDLRSSIPQMYDLGTSNKSDMFAILDDDGDGLVTYDNFLSRRPASVSADQAAVTWQAIVANSGNPDAPNALQENEFVTGLERLWGDSLNSEDAVLLTSLLDTIDGKTNSVLRSVSNLSDLFSTIDSDQNGRISRDDLIASRVSSASEERASLLWRQILANAGVSDQSDSIGESQFVTGYSAVQQASLTEDATQRLADFLAQLQETDSGQSTDLSAEDSGTSTVSFDMSAYNPSDLFALADQDEDGLVSQEDFVSSLSLDRNDAVTLWQHIAGNSGNTDSNAILTEYQFATGYALTQPESMTEPDNYATVQQLLSFLEELRNSVPDTFDLTSVDSELLFDEMDGDQDELVMREDFVNNRPGTLTEDAASQLWDLIASNSGSDNNGELLTRDQFLVGYGATDLTETGQQNALLLDRLERTVQDMLSQQTGGTGLRASNVQTMSDQIDANSDTVLSRDEVLTALGNELGFADIVYSDSERSQYVVQQLVNAMYAYKGLQGVTAGDA